MPPEFRPFRNAAARAMERAGCEVVRAEDHPAKMVAPHIACLDMVASCDGSVTILGPGYGNVTETGYSATEDEYREAVRLRKRVYLFVEKTDVAFEPRQDEFVRSVTGYVGDNWRKTFSSPEQLEALVQQALKEDRDLGAGLNTGAGHDAQDRVAAALQQRPNSIVGIIWLQIVCSPLRDEEVVRPTEFSKPEFQNAIMQLAHTGMMPLFSYTEGKTPLPRSSRLQIIQNQGYAGRGRADLVVLDIYPNGMLSITLNVTALVERDREGLGSFGMYYLDPDDVRARLGQAWGFMGRFWQHVDEFRRYNGLLYNVALHDIGHSRWGKAPTGRTSFSFPMRDAPNPLVAFERPRRITRADLLQSDAEISEASDMLQMRFTELDRV
jgi:Domain of unknown function (DUF4062)